MRIIAFINDASAVRRILDHLGEPTRPPRIAPRARTTAVGGRHGRGGEQRPGLGPHLPAGTGGRLPFTNMSGDLEQEFLTDGVTEDIITELSRFHSLFVIARNSTFTYKGKATDVRVIARELGVRYVLEGSIRAIRTDSG